MIFQANETEILLEETTMLTECGKPTLSCRQVQNIAEFRNEAATAPEIFGHSQGN